MIRHLLLLTLIVIGANLGQAQDAVFSQFYASPLHLNPAFAGVTYAPRITLNYRNQWPALGSAYVTYAATYEHPIEGLNSGIGITVLTDDAGQGLYKTNHVSAIYGYKVQVSESLFAKFGVEVGVYQTLLDWERYVFPDQLNPVTGSVDEAGNPLESGEIPPIDQSKMNLDVGAGILVYTNSFYAGFSVKHLNSPDERFILVNDNLSAGRPFRYTAHAGAEFSLEGRNNKDGGAFISPNILYIKQGDFAQVNGGAYAGFGKFFGGLWYRYTPNNGDAVIGLVGVRAGILRLGYSYDMTVSQLSSYSGGAHEVSVTINFDDSRSTKKRRRNSRYQDCFKMFK